MRKARHRIVWAVCIIMLLAAGCQPTPEEPPVANKETDLVQAVLEAGDDKEAMESDKQTIQSQIEEISGHLEMVINPSERVTINVDADIISPSLEQLPLVRVKPKNLSQEQFEAFMEYIAGDQPLYYEAMDKDGQPYTFTKEEITAILIRVKTYLVNDELPENQRSAWEEMIVYLEEQYETTISRADEKLYDGTLADTEGNGTFNTITRLKCYMGKDRAAWFELWQSIEGTQTQITFSNSNYGSGLYNTYEPYEDVAAERIDMTYEEAKAIAEDFVRTVDGQDSNMVVYQSNIVYEIGTLANYTKETSPQAYAFSFARSYNGVKVKPVGYLHGRSEEIDYSQQVSPESIMVVIGDEGFNQAYWSRHTEYVETLSEDMPLLDFETIQKTFEQHCALEFSWVPQDDALPSDIGTILNVKRIELNLMIIPEKDNPGIYITVPVWDFIADVEYDEEVITDEGLPAYEQENVSILTINAIDGTIIDRERGY